jgi:hypothetical protein
MPDGHENIVDIPIGRMSDDLFQARANTLSPDLVER